VHQDVYPPAEDFDIPMTALARIFIEIVVERKEAHHGVGFACG
jgi:hypothetical protein